MSRRHAARYSRQNCTRPQTASTAVLCQDCWIGLGKVSSPLEASMRAAQSLLDAGSIEEAEAVCTSIEAAYPDEWRATWLRGIAALRRDDASAARRCFEQVYARIPGETAPKLALVFAAESDGEFRLAIRLYDTVSLTAPATTSAAFGLARCSIGLGERQRALDAYRRVPHGARSWVNAMVETVQVLIGRKDNHSPSWSDLVGRRRGTRRYRPRAAAAGGAGTPAARRGTDTAAIWRRASRWSPEPGGLAAHGTRRTTRDRVRVPNARSLFAEAKRTDRIH